MSDIRVGQTWRCDGGAELRVRYVSAEGWGIVGGPFQYTLLRDMTPANGWELVEDVARRYVPP